MGTFRKLLIAIAGLVCCLPVFGKAEVSRNLPHSTGTLLTRYYISGRYELDVIPSGTKERLYLGGDAWGRLRDPFTKTAYAPGSEPELLLGRGFCGHEHLTAFGLINMNARLYDPVTARFLSPDPYVQAPDFSKGFNRYSYCLNNPLKYTDESGELLTWNIGFNGLSIGVNFTPAGIPLGMGINVGWGNGFSLGVYGEIGYRIGGTHIGAGITSSISYDFNFWYHGGAISMSSGAFASLGPLSVSAMTETSVGQTNWNAGVSLGFGNAISGIGLFAGYGSGGWNAGISGYFDNSRRIAFRRGVNAVELNGDDPLLATDDVLRKMQELWYPDAPMDNIIDFTVEHVPNLYTSYFDNEGSLALTRPEHVQNSLTGKSSVYFSKRAFVSARQLFITMGHEFVHVSNYSTAARLGFSYKEVNNQRYLDMTEYWAYTYQREYTGSTMNSFEMSDLIKNYGSNFSAFSFYSDSWFQTRRFTK